MKENNRLFFVALLASSLFTVNAAADDGAWTVRGGLGQEDPIQGFFEHDDQVELGYKFKSDDPLSLHVGWTNFDRLYAPGADFVDNTYFANFIFTPMKNTYLEVYGEDTPQAHFRSNWTTALTPHYLLGDKADLSLGLKLASYPAVSYTTLSPGAVYYLPANSLVGGTIYYTPGPSQITAGRLFVRKLFTGNASVELSGSAGQNLLDQFTIEQFTALGTTLLSPAYHGVQIEVQYEHHWGQILVSNSIYGGFKWSP